MKNTIGCFAIIEDDNHRVLLVKRKDIPLWDLPGGKKDMDESMEECVIREVQEETGLKVEIDYLVGCFQRPRAQDIQYVYACRQVGGGLIQEGKETKKVKYANPSILPVMMIPNRKYQIGCYRKGNVNVEQMIQDRSVLFYLQRMKKN